MKNTLETRLGLFFALAVVVAVLVLEMVGGIDFLRPGFMLNSRFNSIQDLKVGDPVKMAGKQIGRVDDITFADNRVLVRMKISDRSAVIRTDSKATIKFLGLLGQNYVALDFGEKGTVIRTSGQELSVVEQADFAVLMSKLDGVAGDIKRITGNLTDLRIDEIVLPVTDFLKESRPQIMGVLTNFNQMSAQLRSGEGTIGRLLYDETLYHQALTTLTNFNGSATDLQAIFGQARDLVGEISAGKGTAGRLIKDERLYAELTEAASNLREIMQKVNRGQGTAGKIVNDETLINNATLTLQKLDKATDALEDQGPLTVLGILINPLF